MGNNTTIITKVPEIMMYKHPRIVIEGFSEYLAEHSAKTPRKKPERQEKKVEEEPAKPEVPVSKSERKESSTVVKAIGRSSIDGDSSVGRNNFFEGNINTSNVLEGNVNTSNVLEESKELELPEQQNYQGESLELMNVSERDNNVPMPNESSGNVKENESSENVKQNESPENVKETGNVLEIETDKEEDENCEDTLVQESNKCEKTIEADEEIKDIPEENTKNKTEEDEFNEEIERALREEENNRKMEEKIKKEAEEKAAEIAKTNQAELEAKAKDIEDIEAASKNILSKYQ